MVVVADPGSGVGAVAHRGDREGDERKDDHGGHRDGGCDLIETSSEPLSSVPPVRSRRWIGLDSGLVWLHIGLACRTRYKEPISTQVAEKAVDGLGAAPGRAAGTVGRRGQIRSTSSWPHRSLAPSRWGSSRPGTRLPAERELARELALSRTTIVAAYDRLRLAGLARSRQGSGTGVAARRPGPVRSHMPRRRSSTTDVEQPIRSVPPPPPLGAPPSTRRSGSSSSIARP